MTYTLYSKKGSGGFAVEAALVKAGAPFKIVTVNYDQGEQHSAAFAKINPMQQVPALILPDGTLMTESAAMLIHIASAFPDQGLAPPAGTSGNGRFLRWMLFMVVNLYEADLRYFYPERYTADTDTAGIDDIRVAGAAHMAMSFALMEPELDPFLFGKELSIADVYLAMLSIWSPAPLTTMKYTALRAAVAADGHYGPVWVRHGFADRGG
jgi:glutathione S-transferase